MELVDEDFPWNEWMPQLAPHISFCKGSIAEEISPDELQKWGYKSPAQLEDITVSYVRYKGRLHIQQKDADGPYLSSHGGVDPFDIPLWTRFQCWSVNGSASLCSTTLSSPCPCPAEAAIT